MAKTIKDKTVVITGASAGVGAACARRFAAAGARLVLAARGEQALRAVADSLPEACDVLTVATDVSDPDQCRRLIDASVERFGGVDILVNNAGVNHRGAVRERSVDELIAIVNTNLRAPIVLARLALTHMPRGGAIVNVASIAGQIPVPDEATYSATKAGLRAFGFALGQELEAAGIDVSAVSPGPIDTGFIMEDIDEVPDLVFSQPMSSADEIADLVLQCAADGKRERSKPYLSHLTATLGYLAPSAIGLLRGPLEKKGRRIKQQYRDRARG